jgi:hypothetical protein
MRCHILAYLHPSLIPTLPFLIFVAPYFFSSSSQYTLPLPYLTFPTPYFLLPYSPYSHLAVIYSPLNQLPYPLAPPSLFLQLLLHIHLLIFLFFLGLPYPNLPLYRFLILLFIPPLLFPFVLHSSHLLFLSSFPPLLQSFTVYSFTINFLSSYITATFPAFSSYFCMISIPYLSSYCIRLNHFISYSNSMNIKVLFYYRS